MSQFLPGLAVIRTIPPDVLLGLALKKYKLEPVELAAETRPEL